MVEIGTFKPASGGYRGTLTTLTTTAKVDFVALQKGDSDRAPTHRVTHLGREIGAAWQRTAKSGAEFLSVVLNDPAFPQPIRATLFAPREGSEAWSLCWDPAPNRDRD